MQLKTPDMNTAYHFEVLSEGAVTHAPAGTSRHGVMVGPRCVMAPDDKGGFICTYMAQSQLGVNDFTPMVTRSNSVSDTWSDPQPIWPELAGRYSVFCNISRAGNDLYLFGNRSIIDTPGEPCWSDQDLGLKANELIWARSRDGGRTWTDPKVSPWPYPGSAETPGPMLITHPGRRWVGVYSPYNVMGEPGIRVDRERVISVTSDDCGTTWQPAVMIQFDQHATGGAEAWVTQLTDGRLLGVTWHVDLTGDNRAFANCYAISHDEGATWCPTRSTGIVANTTALLPLSNNRALFTTVRRGKNDAGIWLSIIHPSDDNFGVLSDQCVWSGRDPTQDGDAASHDNWTAFTFGEPCVVEMAAGMFLLVFWYIDKTGASIRYLHMRLHDDHA